MTDKLQDFGRRTRRRVEYHFSPKAGKEKWNKLLRSASSKEFHKALEAYGADPKLILHVKSLHELRKGKTLQKIKSSRGKGKTYEVTDIGEGRLGCTCPDWRYRGTVRPGYECKHIREYKGKAKMAGLGDQVGAFFDELSKINEKGRAEHDKSYKRSGRPFSSLLTQDEEPEPYPKLETAEPEVILGH